MSCFRTACRVAAGIYFVVVLLAVLWDSGSEIAELKESVGPWFLNAEGKDIILNLVMLAPLTLLAHLGWPRTAWWHWALAGCALGAGAAAEFLRADLAEAGVRLVDATAASNSSGPAVSGIIEHPGGRMVASTNARVEVDPALARRALESMQHLDVVLVDGHNPGLAQSALTAGTHPATDPDDPFAELEARPAHLRVLDGGSWKDWFTPLLGLVDVAVVSADFAPPLLRAPDGAQVAGFLRGFGITRTVRTQGPGPVQFWWDGRSGEVEVEPVDAASTLGAGDAFHGAFAWGCARYRRVGAPISDPRGLIRFASAVARVSVASFGTRRWLSSPELQRCVESFEAGPAAEPGGPGGAPGR